MSKQRMNATLIAAAFVAVACGGSSGSPAAAMARQFVALATAGDPGTRSGLNRAVEVAVIPLTA